MATLVVTVTADDGTTQQYTLPVTINRGTYPGRAAPGKATYPSKRSS